MYSVAYLPGQLPALRPVSPPDKAGPVEKLVGLQHGDSLVLCCVTDNDVGRDGAAWAGGGGEGRAGPASRARVSPGQPAGGDVRGRNGVRAEEQVSDLRQPGKPGVKMQRPPDVMIPAGFLPEGGDGLLHAPVLRPRQAVPVLPDGPGRGGDVAVGARLRLRALRLAEHVLLPLPRTLQVPRQL